VRECSDKLMTNFSDPWMAFGVLFMWWWSFRTENFQIWFSFYLRRDAQQTNQCVYSIPCDCGRCYIGETSRPLEVRIKEHKYNLTQGLLEKSKLAQHAYEESHKICWNEAKVYRLSPTTHTKIQGISSHVSAGPSHQSTQFGHLSNLDPRYHSRSQNTTTPSNIDWMGNFVFLVLVP
jgi:hypothetical protein